MKKFVIFLFLLPLYGPIMAQSPPHQLEISRELMEGCEMGTAPCDPLVIIRKSSSDAWEIILPGGGTFSTVSLLPAVASNQPIIDDRPIGPRLLRQDNCGANRQPRIRLAGIPDGEYLISMTSCALGGTFSLSITTENP